MLILATSHDIQKKELKLILILLIPRSIWFLYFPKKVQRHIFKVNSGIVIIYSRQQFQYVLNSSGHPRSVTSPSKHESHKTKDMTDWIVHFKHSWVQILNAHRNCEPIGTLAQLFPNLPPTHALGYQIYADDLFVLHSRATKLVPFHCRGCLGLKVIIYKAMC